MKQRILLIWILLSVFGPTYAEDSPVAEKDPVWLTQARASIRAEKFDQAIQQLQSANETTSADWNNLLGYSLRKKQPPDLDAAEQFYRAALKLDPDHRGALEYYGKLKLTRGDVLGAEALLSRLEKICFFGCEEYTDLKEAVTKFKAR